MKTKISLLIFTGFLSFSLLNSCKTFNNAMYNYSTDNNLKFASVKIDSLSIKNEFYGSKDYFLRIFKDKFGVSYITREYYYMYDKKKLNNLDTLSIPEFCKILDDRFIKYEITNKGRIRILEKTDFIFNYGTVGGRNSIIVNNKYIYNRNVEDALIILNNYSKNYQTNSINTSNKYNMKIGISDFNCKVNKLYFIPTLCTLTVINLFGFPWASQKAEINLDVDIYDNNNVIKHYNIKGSANKAAAYYWGYTVLGAINKDGNSTLNRVVVTYALKDALEKLDKSLAKDF